MCLVVSQIVILMNKFQGQHASQIEKTNSCYTRRKTVIYVFEAL